jgi:hypothetical protein
MCAPRQAPVHRGHEARVEVALREEEHVGNEGHLARRGRGVVGERLRRLALGVCAARGGAGRGRRERVSGGRGTTVAGGRASAKATGRPGACNQVARATGGWPGNPPGALTAAAALLLVLRNAAVPRQSGDRHAGDLRAAAASLGGVPPRSEVLREEVWGWGWGGVGGGACAGWDLPEGSAARLIPSPRLHRLALAHLRPGARPLSAAHPRTWGCPAARPARRAAPCAAAPRSG